VISLVVLCVISCYIYYIMFDVRCDIGRALGVVCDAISRASVQSLLVADKHTYSTCTAIQAVHALKFDDPLATMLHGIIMRHAVVAETTGPGCHSRFIQSLLKALSACSGSHQQHTTFGDTEGVRGTRTACGAVSADLQRAVERHVDARYVSLINDAISLAGPTGKIVVERSASMRCSIELIDGYMFDNVAFVWKGTRFASPLVACVDGFIESVAEINMFLTELAETRDRCLLFVRGMADEVKHTLRTNYDVGRLGVFPIIVPFELEGINTLNDVSIVCGCDLVTSIKGDLISNMGIHSTARVASATCTKRSVMITNNVTRQGVERHSHVLSERIRAGDQNTAKMLEQRVMSLVPRTVVVRLPNDDTFVRTAQGIDNTLRAVRALVRYGVVGQDRESAASSIAVETSVDWCVADITGIGAALVKC
jgi:hypothetical protein